MEKIHSGKQLSIQRQRHLKNEKKQLPPPIPKKPQIIIESQTLREIVNKLPQKQDQNNLIKLNEAIKNMRGPFKQFRAKKITKELGISKEKLKKILKEYKANNNLTNAKLSQQFGPRVKKMTGIASESTGLSFHRRKKGTNNTTQQQNTVEQKPALPPRPQRKPAPKIR